MFHTPMHRIRVPGSLIVPFLQGHWNWLWSVGVTLRVSVLSAGTTSLEDALLQGPSIGVLKTQSWVFQPLYPAVQGRCEAASDGKSVVF